MLTNSVSIASKRDDEEREWVKEWGREQKLQKPPAHHHQNSGVQKSHKSITGRGKFS